MRSAGAPATSAMTSLIRFAVPSSTPFIKLTSVAFGGSNGVQSRRFARSVCEGMASATISAPPSASAASCVAVSRSGSSKPFR